MTSFFVAADGKGIPIRTLGTELGQKPHVRYRKNQQAPVGPGAPRLAGASVCGKNSNVRGKLLKTPLGATRLAAITYATEALRDPVGCSKSFADGWRHVALEVESTVLASSDTREKRGLQTLKTCPT